MASLDLDILDIEIINHPAKAIQERWDCDQCSLFYLTKEKLHEHKSKTHSKTQELDVKCRYCGKGLTTNDSKECIMNKKCETCEYRCIDCSQRFLRYSSLVNHEKNHSCKNKKKPIMPSKTPVNGVAPKKSIKTLLPKRRPSEQLEKEPLIVPNKTPKPANDENSRKKQKLLSSTGNVSDVSLNNNTKTPKVPKKKSINTVKESSTKKANSKPTTPQKNSTTPSKTSSSSPKINIPVNYKPFSCHICEENFAFDKFLLEHLKSHGDAANRFKCKYCGDEFDTIYKMQFHLATCELADNEIETLQNSIPPLKLTPKKLTDEMPDQRKKGRPRKTPAEIANESLEKLEEKASKRGRSKRFSEETPQELRESEDTDEIPKSNKKRKIENTPTKPKRSPSKRTLRALKEPTPTLPDPSPEPTAMVDCGEFPPDDDFHLEYTEDPLADDTKEGIIDTASQTKMDEKKVHACPWPKCTFKFSREKALLCHMKNHQSGEDLDEHLKCHLCDIPFEDVTSLRQHINECKENVTNEEKDEDFYGRRTKQKRQSPEKPSAKQPFQPACLFRCDVCERVYPTEEKLARHLETHKGSLIACHYCNEMFSVHYWLVEHCKQKHPGKSSYRCYTCKENFISELFLKIHMTEYHGGIRNLVASETNKETEPAPVVETQVQTITVRTLSSTSLKMLPGVSYKLKTSKEVSFASISKSFNRIDSLCCPLCFEDFEDRGVLHDHFRMKHIIEMSSLFVCEICEVEKPTVEMLLYHLETHSRFVLSVNRFSNVRQFFADGGRKKNLSYSAIVSTASESNIANLDQTSNSHCGSEFDDTTDNICLTDIVDQIVDTIIPDTLITSGNKSVPAVGNLRKSDVQKGKSSGLNFKRKRRNKKIWTKKRAKFDFEKINSKVKIMGEAIIENVQKVPQDVKLHCELETEGSEKDVAKDSNESSKTRWTNEDIESQRVNQEEMQSVPTLIDDYLINGKEATIQNILELDHDSKNSLVTNKRTSISKPTCNIQNSLSQEPFLCHGQNSEKLLCSYSSVNKSSKQEIKISKDFPEESSTVDTKSFLVQSVKKESYKIETATNNVLEKINTSDNENDKIMNNTLMGKEHNKTQMEIVSSKERNTTENEAGTNKMKVNVNIVNKENNDAVEENLIHNENKKIPKEVVSSEEKNIDYMKSIANQEEKNNTEEVTSKSENFNYEVIEKSATQEGNDKAAEVSIVLGKINDILINHTNQKENKTTKNKIHSIQETKNEANKVITTQRENDKCKEQKSETEEENNEALKNYSTQEKNDTLEEGIGALEEKSYVSHDSKGMNVVKASCQEANPQTTKETENHYRSSLESIKGNFQDLPKANPNKNNSEITTNSVVSTQDNEENTTELNTAKNANNSENISTLRSESDDEIPCTMCSLVFYDQDSYMDHLALHILD